MTQLSPVPTPAPPEPTSRGIRAMFAFRDVPRQWPVGLRTAICVAGPALVGWLAGDLSAGLLAAWVASPACTVAAAVSQPGPTAGGHPIAQALAVSLGSGRTRLRGRVSSR